MGVLNNIQAVPKDDRERPPVADATGEEAAARTRSASRRLVVTLDIGRNVVLVIVIVGLVGAATLLYAREQDDAARVLVDILIAVISGGLGVNFGERSGAQEASRELGGGA